jgi:hypothetical protein
MGKLISQAILSILVLAAAFKCALIRKVAQKPLYAPFCFFGNFFCLRICEPLVSVSLSAIFIGNRYGNTATKRVNPSVAYGDTSPIRGGIGTRYPHKASPTLKFGKLRRFVLKICYYKNDAFKRSACINFLMK